MHAPFRRRDRLLIAVGVAVAAALIVLWHFREPGHHGDIDQVWFSAQALLRGENAYAVVGQRMRDFELIYPLSTGVAALPLAWIPVEFFRILFVSASAGLFAYAISARGTVWLPLLLSAPMLSSIQSANWPPLLTAALLMPGLSWLLPMKPTTGLAMLATMPRRRAIWMAGISAVLLATVAFVMQPGWHVEWMESIRATPHLRPQILGFAGPLLLVALFRWRRWDARLVLATALVPHTPLVYDALPLGLIAETRMQSYAFALLTYAALIAQKLVMPQVGEGRHVAWALGILNVLIWLPCLVVVLRRPQTADDSTLRIDGRIT